MSPSDLEIPGHLVLTAGEGGLEKACVETRWSSAEIYCHGAHVTHFRKTGEAPLLFMSAASRFRPGQPIRGGIPVVFPWFGPREGLPSHGFARTVEWQLERTALLDDGAVRLAFRLPEIDFYQVEYIVTVAETLTLEMLVNNDSPGRDAIFENCLHSYFHVGDVRGVSVSGLAGAPYFDKVAGADAPAEDGPVRIAGEVDRVYRDTAATVEIEDPQLRRVIRISKTGSRTTVVWNPWIEKSAALPDLGDEEYPHFLCVEAGNAGDEKITLAPSETASMTVEIGSRPLA